MGAVNLVGFDSAWADNRKKPGAFCALRQDGTTTTFVAPIPVGFDQALDQIKRLHQPGDLTLVAIDQPTIVNNPSGMRPAEKVVAGTISWSGGGMQPSSRKAPLFGEDAPIRRFLKALRGLGSVDDPERAAIATEGLFVMEVYPALALLSLDVAFVSARGLRPCYNPANRSKFRHGDWCAVCAAACTEGRRLGLDDVAISCEAMLEIETPNKSHQDNLDALICLLVAKRWREGRASCVMVGDLETGYIVAPVGDVVRKRLSDAASRACPAVQIA